MSKAKKIGLRFGCTLARLSADPKLSRAILRNSSYESSNIDAQELSLRLSRGLVISHPILTRFCANLTRMKEFLPLIDRISCYCKLCVIYLEL